MSESSHEKKSKTSEPPIDTAATEAMSAQALAETLQKEASSNQVERFVQSFERSARRWEIVVYPALFAFVVLAGYGFFLIYSLTNSVASIARSMDPNMGEHMESMAQNINVLSTEIKDMSREVKSMSLKMEKISVQMESMPPLPIYMQSMDESMSTMNQSMAHLNTSINNIALTTENMRQSMANMNQSVSRPMSFFNSFAPW